MGEETVGSNFRLGWDINFQLAEGKKKASELRAGAILMHGLRGVHVPPAGAPAPTFSRPKEQNRNADRPTSGCSCRSSQPRPCFFNAGHDF